MNVRSWVCHSIYFEAGPWLYKCTLLNYTDTTVQWGGVGLLNKQNQKKEMFDIYFKLFECSASTSIRV